MMSNPPIHVTARIFALLAILAVILGSALLFAPPLIVERWPWTLTPFNARFLGAIYLGELIGLVLMLWIGRISPGRIALLLSIVFAGIVTVVSALHLDQFDPNRPITLIWFILYGGAVILAGVLLWVHRQLKAVAQAAHGRWRMYLQVVVIIYTAYGIGMLLLPDTFTAFWPWAVDVWHAQVYSAPCILVGLGAWLLMRGARSTDYTTIGVTLVALGGAAVLSTLLLDMQVQRVDWSLPGSLFWVVLFGAIAVIGMSYLIYARTLSRIEAESEATPS